MTGAMTICTIHSYMFNVSEKQWQPISPEMMEELKDMASEIQGVNVWEGACPECLTVVNDSFYALYEARDADAKYRELQSEMGDIE